MICPIFHHGRSLLRAGCFTVLVLSAATPSVSFGQLPKRYELADLKALEQAFVRLAENVRPSVVAVLTYQLRDRSDESARRVRVSQGSGFIIDAEGYIATNRHVIEDANSYAVVLYNGDRYEASLRQTDVRNDIAVLKIDAPNLTPVRWGDLADVKVGQWTFAVGNPFGLANESGESSVTVGAVSALGREMTRRLNADSQSQYYGNLIETCSAINPGNSGGPLFNIDGRVIGIVTAIETGSGVNEGAGFAIPIDKNTRRILDTLKQGQSVHYGYLGIKVENLDEPLTRLTDTRAARGVRITDIDPKDGPAARAGLQPGDVVLEVDGVPIADSDHLVRQVSFTPVGSEVEVTYIRRQVKRKATAMLGDRNEILRLSAGE